MTQLHDLTALEQAAAVRRREVSPRELVDHYLDRVARHDATVGAFVLVTAESARATADTATAVVLAGGDLPPLHGVPTAVKDLNLTAGVRTALGSAVFTDLVPTLDDHVVTALRRAGTISLGKTNTPEFGLPCYTEPDVAPPARTPWDLTRSAGGSSGGAAAAVAAGLVPFAQGSDGGGSVRIPASVCGLVGIKVSRGRISNGPLGGDLNGLAWNGPLARTVADCAALLDAMAGPAVGDPHWAASLPAGGTFLSGLDTPVRPLRIGRYAAPPVRDAVVHPDCLAAYEKVSQLLEELGHDVVEIDCPFPAEALGLFTTLWSVSACSVPVDPQREADLRPLTRYLRAQGRTVTGPEYVTALAAVQRMARAAVVATDHLDVVLTPTLAQPPVPVGGLRDDDDPAADFAAQTRFTPFTAVYNATGQPALSVPLHHSAAGLPIGIQLVGRPADELTLLRLARQLEDARPWIGRQPALWRT